jgi:peptidyl-prolyl cis-trans isomerase A (cyclophilin A)
MRRACKAGVLAACCLLYGCGSPAPEPAGKEAAAEKKAPQQAPPEFRVNLDTSKGPVVIEVHRNWAPLGADQFYTLVKTGFYDGARFFRVRPRFVVQFGIAGDPKKNRLWQTAPLPDDPVKETNAKGTVTYATAGPNTRTTQVFINLGDNRRLDKQGFAPFGKVVSGMEAVESLYSFYGEMAPGGAGPDPTEIERRGNEYLDAKFPRLDFIKKAVIE